MRGEKCIRAKGSLSSRLVSVKAFLVLTFGKLFNLPDLQCLYLGNGDINAYQRRLLCIEIYNRYEIIISIKCELNLDRNIFNSVNIIIPVIIKS